MTDHSFYWTLARRVALYLICVLLFWLQSGEPWRGMLFPGIWLVMGMLALEYFRPHPFSWGLQLPRYETPAKAVVSRAAQAVGWVLYMTAFLIPILRILPL